MAVFNFTREQLKEHPRFAQLSPQKRRSCLGMLHTEEQKSCLTFLENQQIVAVSRANWNEDEFAEDWVCITK